VIDSKYLGRAVSLLVFLPVVLIGQRAQENVVPLKNWATPLYWHPNQAERETAARPTPELKFSANQISAGALTFVAITPCRLVDTRGAAAGFIGVTPFNGPGVPAGGGNLTFPVQSSAQTSTTAPAPCGAIPSIAAAYSINLTVVPAAGGAVDNVSVWPAGSTQPFVATLNDPQGIIAQNAAIVPAGTPFGGFSFHSTGPAATDVIIDMNGYYSAPTDLSANTAIGAGTLASNTTGSANTAIGTSALQDNTTGGNNTASGLEALQDNTTGYENTADGVTALQNNTTGYFNTASGFRALLGNTTGFNNIAIGYEAAYNVSGANSSNIHIGSYGVSADNNAIRIGNPAVQTSFFVAGVSGVHTGLGSPVPVLIDANGQLGTMSSSRRFKEDIQDMGEASSGLMSLRPVTFRYMQPYTDGSKPIDYGLIAEEVADVYPDLVAYSPSGEVQTVQYQKVNAMLLNEVQKQHQQIQAQQEEMSELKARLAKLEKQPEKRRKR